MSSNAQRLGILIVIGLVANLASFALFSQLQMGPHPAPERYPVLEQDSSVYAALADNLITHHTFSETPDGPPFRKWPIGYPLFLAFTKIISGGFLFAVLLQVLASIGASVLVYKMARTLIPEQYALIPALLYVADPYLLFLNTSILSDGLFTSLLIGIVYLLFFGKEKNLREFFCIGFLLGVAALMRPIAQFLVILLPLGYWFYRRIPWTQFWRFVGVFAVGFLLIVTPWVLRNAVVFGTPEIGHIASFDLLYYNAQEFLTLKELRAERPQPILLASSPVSTSEAVAASARVSARIDSDLARLTPPSANPDAYEGRLGLSYILQDPFYYGYFHVVSMTSFFLEGNVRGYETQARSLANRNGFSVPAPSLFGALHDLRSAPGLETRLGALVTLAAPVLELLWRSGLVVLALLALLLATGRTRRLYLVLAALIGYFAFLTGPIGISTPRLHMPVEPYLLLLATAGVVALFPILVVLYHSRAEFGRFLISGVSTTVLDLALLYAGTEYLKLPYLISASLALVIAYSCSFLLQRNWSFKNTGRSGISLQALGFGAFVLWNIALNAALLWFFVHEVFLWYIAAQFVVSVCIAIESYVVYKRFLFRKPSSSLSQSPVVAVG